MAIDMVLLDRAYQDSLWVTPRTLEPFLCQISWHDLKLVLFKSYSLFSTKLVIKLQEENLGKKI